MAGFSPLVAIATSDERASISSDLAFEHQLEDGYVGFPLNPPVFVNYTIGFLDSGADVDLAAGSFADILGIFGPHLTENSIPIGGVGGTVDALISQPIGFFAAGLSAVDASGVLNTNALVGHSNVSVVVSPPLDCGNGEILTAIVGMPFMAFRNSIIRVDTPRTITTLAGETLTGPDVQFLDPLDPLPEFPQRIAMEFGGLAPATTASFFPNIEDLQTPITPTLMSLSGLSFPLGGAFFASMLVLEGEPGPLNPARSIRVLVDTGAQSSIINPGVAASLNLPLEPDFRVDVCGVGGLDVGVPGYNIDFVRINALGGALDFSNAPFVVLDLPSTEGGPLDGILGMNFFWNRNVIFEPSLAGSGFLHVSAPVPFAVADLDFDLDVDYDDAAAFVFCMTGPGMEGLGPECHHVDADGNDTADLYDFAHVQNCFSGAGEPADPDCGR